MQWETERYSPHRSFTRRYRTDEFELHASKSRSASVPGWFVFVYDAAGELLHREVVWNVRSVDAFGLAYVSAARLGLSPKTRLKLAQEAIKLA